MPKKKRKKKHKKVKNKNQRLKTIIGNNNRPAGSLEIKLKNDKELERT